MPRKQTREEFIEKAHLVHNNKYDYTKSDIDGSKTNDKIQINCHTHNITFFQMKSEHIGGKTGCNICVKIKQENTSLDKYGYKYPCQNLDVIEKNKKTRATNLPNKLKYNLETFIEKSREKHGDKYDYSSVILENLRETKYKVKIRCLKHNVDFIQNFYDHIFGKTSCRQCSNENRVKTNLEKYGKEYYLQTEDKLEKSKKTCLEKYGVENPSQSSAIQSKKQATSMKNYNTTHPMKTVEHRERIIKSNLEKYGVSHPIQLVEVREKIKKTNLERYGVENVGQSPELIRKMIASSFKTKYFTSPSGKVFSYLGYEHFALKKLLFDDKIDENLIETDPDKIPVIQYEIDGKKHNYYPDIWIESQNKLIEVKSTFTYNKELNVIDAKMKATNESGYNIELIVYDSKGNVYKNINYNY